MNFFSSILIFLFLTICGNTHAQQSRNTSPILGRQYISTSAFSNLPQDQKNIMLANPDKFFVEGISQQVITTEMFSQMLPSRQSYIQNNPNLFRIVNATPTNTILQEEFDNMPHERRAYILANLDIYKIKNVGLPTLTSAPTDKISVSQTDLLNMPADKQAHINAHPDLYEITN
jgi:hypothetical protein